VTLNRPWEAGEISNISLAVTACSVGQLGVLLRSGVTSLDIPNPLEPACIRDTIVKLLS
jgi:hypothetical protein